MHAMVPDAKTNDHGRAKADGWPRTIAARDTG
jgi:hypothetical protein